MKAVILENALRRIANSGNSEIIYGSATALSSVIKDDSKLEELTKLLDEYIKEYEEKHQVKLSP